MEAIACAYVRPRSWVWLVGPTMKLADRAFEKVLTTIQDLGLETQTIQNSGQNKLIVLKNGSKIEGVSLRTSGQWPALPWTWPSLMRLRRSFPKFGFVVYCRH